MDPFTPPMVSTPHRCSSRIQGGGSSCSCLCREKGTQLLDKSRPGINDYFNLCPQSFQFFLGFLQESRKQGKLVVNLCASCYPEVYLAVQVSVAVNHVFIFGTVAIVVFLHIYVLVPQKFFAGLGPPEVTHSSDASQEELKELWKRVSGLETVKRSL